MQVVSQAKFKSLEFIESRRAKGLRSEFLKTLVALSVGEAVVVKKAEWKSKGTPNAYITSLKKRDEGKGKSFALRTLKDESGWAVQRTK